MKLTKVGIMYMITIVTSFGLLASSTIVNSAYSAAVKVPSPNTGNKKLDSSIPKFFSCINSAVKSNQHKNVAAYFKHEPTRNEMIACYKKTINM